jgi:NAD(P)-dependent dehydrogenase (short-subunit alcohol dehydrogenase family)/pimeloyl-ACP methyl ester carboxylesterase
MVRSGTVNLAVYEHGDPSRPTLLLVHGYPDTAAVWTDVVAALADRYHVVTYDVRGAGASDAPRGRAAYDVTNLVADLHAVADAVSPEQPVHLVGHDWGSSQAWEAVTEPDAGARIASFTSLSGPGLDHVGFWVRRRLTRPTPRHLRQLVRQLTRSWYIAGMQLPVLPELVVRHVLTPRWADYLARVERVAPRPDHPAPTLRADAVNGIELYRRNLMTTRPPRERRTDVPVQTIRLARDHYVTPALLDDLADWVPRLWTRTLDAGHWAPLTHGPEVAAMVAELVDHVQGATSARTLAAARVGADPFAHKVVVVTGSGSGIGRATALAFAARGAVVVGCDRDHAAAERTAIEARVAGGTAHAYEVDVSDEAAVAAFAATVAEEHGVPDVVVNNAGIGHAGPFLATTTAQWRRVLDVNLWGVIHGCRAFGSLMVGRGQGGHIVNLASAAAYTPTRILPAYATSKAAVLMLSECLRAELAGHGIGVSAVCPGVVDTNITRTTTWSGATDAEQDAHRERTSRLYARRGYGPERVAEQIVRAVARDTPVVPVTIEARVSRLLSRVAPAVLRRAARL